MPEMSIERAGSGSLRLPLMATVGRFAGLAADYLESNSGLDFSGCY